jgi:hypothetical protein
MEKKVTEKLVPVMNIMGPLEHKRLMEVEMSGKLYSGESN